ncbi:isoprenylcysteine carboxylmethyltransferase family protein [Vibrio sp. B1Z05]|uniref:methyltransferase family protein n=1 Tax=Vibrio sp. B1Z05 TaxID=2654980 RepID=UPI0020A64CED|nr:isoprenylcysteine carboxylmethyltransferase family protein [Vibrio sp. B1Z05]
MDISLLNHKIPPPVVLLVCALLAGYIADFSFTDNPCAWLIAVMLVLISLGLAWVSIDSFKKENTTVNPLQPSKTQNLVTHGVYRYSRNPMYLSLAILLVAWASLLASWTGIFGCLIFVMYITQFQIKPEERALMHKFPQSYTAYLKRVRRWL